MTPNAPTCSTGPARRRPARPGRTWPNGSWATRSRSGSGSGTGGPSSTRSALAWRSAQSTAGGARTAIALLQPAVACPGRPRRRSGRRPAHRAARPEPSCSSTNTTARLAATDRALAAAERTGLVRLAAEALDDQGQDRHVLGPAMGGASAARGGPASWPTSTTCRTRSAGDGHAGRRRSRMDDVAARCASNDRAHRARSPLGRRDVGAHHRSATPPRTPGEPANGHWTIARDRGRVRSSTSTSPSRRHAALASWRSSGSPGPLPTVRAREARRAAHRRPRRRRRRGRRLRSATGSTISRSATSGGATTSWMQRGRAERSQRAVCPAARRQGRGHGRGRRRPPARHSSSSTRIGTRGRVVDADRAAIASRHRGDGWRPTAALAGYRSGRCRHGATLGCPGTRR